MRTRQNSGYRQISWNRVTGGAAHPEYKHGRGRLTAEDTRTRLDDLKVRINLILADKPCTIRDFIAKLNAYETDIKRALAELGVKPARAPGSRHFLYAIPTAKAA